MMFQKSRNEAGILAGGSPMLTSDMNSSDMERGFAQVRRRSTARANRKTVKTGMFSRGSGVYRHV